MQTENEILEAIKVKRAGAFTHLVYEREIDIAKKYGVVGKITSLLDMIGRTGCDYSHLPEAMERAKQRIESNEPKRAYNGPKAVVRNRIYEAKDGSILIRFYPIHVRSKYFLDGKEVELSDLLAMLPEGALKLNKTCIMSLKLKGIKKVK